MNTDDFKRRISLAESHQADVTSGRVADHPTRQLLHLLSIDAKYLIAEVERMEAHRKAADVLLRKAIWLAKEIGDSGPAMIRRIPIDSPHPEANMCVLCDKIVPLHATLTHEDQCAKYRAQRLTIELETFLRVKAPGSPERGEALIAEATAKGPDVPELGAKVRRRFEKFTPIVILRAGLEGSVCAIEPNGTVWAEFFIDGKRICDAIGPHEVEIISAEGSQGDLRESIPDNTCEHGGDHPAPDNKRFCSDECSRCDDAEFDAGNEGCAGICANGPAGKAEG